MKIIVTEDPTRALVQRVPDEIVVLHCTPNIEDNCLIVAERQWAEQHRAALRQLPGYHDWGAPYPNHPAQIQVYQTSSQAREHIERIISQ